MTTTAPYAWVKKIEDSLQTMGLVPLWGSPPPFPWQAISEYLRETLNLSSLDISLEASEWLSQQQLLESMGASPIKIDLSLIPLSGAMHWVMSRQDISKLITCILSSISTKGFADPQFQEGFYRYVALEVLNALSAFAPFEDLSATLAEPSSQPIEGGLCLSIRVACNKITLWGKLICTAPLHRAFLTHFSLRRPSLLASEVTKSLDLPLRVEVGHTTLSLAQWETVKAGDCILLDECLYDPQTHKGNATLLLDSQPLFHIRLKDHQVKILQHIFYQEDMMSTHDEEENKQNQSPEEDQFEEHHANDKEESGEFEEEHEEAQENAEELPSEEDASWNEYHSESTEHLVAARTIPLTLNVEVARIRMNLEKLLQLQPGNLIDLEIKPEHGVHLTVNGAIVAKGELVKIGETIGVKILKISERS